MKVRHGEPIPRCFRDHPAGGKIAAEVDIKLHSVDLAAHTSRERPGRLAVKLLIFKNPKDMAVFARRALGVNNDDCAGFVHELGYERHHFEPGKPVDKTHIVDPNYTCVMALNQETGLSMEVITHESVHAGFFHARRSRMVWPNQKNCPDEAVCYPAGRIAAAINRFVHDKGLYPTS
jgi:hypothetical protein